MKGFDPTPREPENKLLLPSAYGSTQHKSNVVRIVWKVKPSSLDESELNIQLYHCHTKKFTGIKLSKPNKD